MADLWLYVSTIGVGLLVLLLVFELTASLSPKAGGLPAPPGLPFLGHWLTLHPLWPRAAAGDRGDPLLVRLSRWSAAHGGAFALRTGWLPRALLGGPRLVVVLSEPGAVHALMAAGEDTAPKSRRHYGWLEHIAKAKAISLTRAALSLGPGGLLDAGDAAARLSLDVLGLKMNYDFQAVEARGEVPLLRLLREVGQEVEAARSRPLGRAAPWFDDGAARAQLSCRILQELELWASIEASGPPPPEDVTLGAQLARLRSPPSLAASASVPAALPLERALSELAAALLLGAETTAAVLAAALYCLAANRAAQELLLAGWRVPAGAELWVDAFSMHRSPQHWRDPDTFRPERWEAAAAAALAGPSAATGSAAAPPSPDGRPYDGMCTVELEPGAEGEAVGQAGGGSRERAHGAGAADSGGGSGDEGAPPLCSPHAFMPFGSGPRSCLGQRLAVAEVKAALAVLLSYIVLQPAGEAAEGGLPLRRGMFLVPQGGVHVLVAPRKRA
ncbi:hypothetical protein GPECTOR_144g729 [Gonium pectorale]|uniref:Cytochrome P450 n=1 Tax=Gonium pectorale TaxID=33097 RepID=A0A150FXY8_GONPE|nr:hypothetical protein GPECTOR_144g729 [Gonium pectorale]|eukprot:KXZ42466.1 hypothetical protein GPECTOR_144g729 [Gonium pectorale]